MVRSAARIIKFGVGSMFRSVIFFISLFITFTAAGSEKIILVLGDSLSASHGIVPEAGWVFQLRERLGTEGYRYKVINASISGETTHGANKRLDGILREMTPHITIVELGGNDGLRGIPLAEIRDNLQDIIEKISFSGSNILLVEMLLPPNYGAAYIENFVAVYKKLGSLDNVTLAKFILDNIADDPDLMQSDGIHPTAEAQEMMLDNLWPYLYPLLDKDANQ